MTSSYTASGAFLDALQELGVDYIFANFGSDHPAIVEALAEARAAGRPLPQVITCPNEMVGMSAAHGFAAATGRPQAVLVHVECGTQALAGAVHNAAKGRIPIFVFAGASPVTQDGEMKGSRNEFIQWIQDVHDQRGIVRGYMRYEGEIRAAGAIKQLVARAFQFAQSDPKGPVYLIGAREVMEAPAKPAPLVVQDWQPVAGGAMAPDAVAEVAKALSKARAPLVVTSFLGRKPAAVGELVKLCERLGVGVLESVPNYVNFPHDNPLYQGNQWNEPHQNAALADADVVLVIDSDVPWIPMSSEPNAKAKIYHIDVDPLKAQMPLWYIAAGGRYAADAGVALGQINSALDGMTVDDALVQKRRRRWAKLHEARKTVLAARENSGDLLTAQRLTAALRHRITKDTLVVNEGISNYQTIFDHLALTRPGSMFTSGGGSLGWNGGAAIGAKLAHPKKTVIALTGDGSFMFSVPSSVHWMARRYNTPFLTVVYNNGGWKSPKLSTLAVHPDGYASRADNLDMSFHPQADYAGIAAAAGGAHPEIVSDLKDLEAALDRCFHAVNVEGRAAVLDVRLANP
ncbi:MAG TPA: thiamine pyrophosphate-requiring protein [Caulobacteraceae bacterium]|nr:thiamine pyrophosphate-requiring protein [Caulobacteraceae bacterium]